MVEITWSCCWKTEDIAKGALYLKARDVLSEYDESKFKDLREIQFIFEDKKRCETSITSCGGSKC